MKIQIFYFTIIVLLLKSNFVLNEAKNWQAIWYNSYTATAAAGALTNIDFHNLQMKIETYDFINPPSPPAYTPTTYLAMITRNDDITNVDVQNIKNDQNNLKYVFYLLKLNGNQYLGRMYVIWDLTCNSTDKVKSFKIKYFLCGTDVDTFFTGLGTGVDKVKNYGTNLIAQNAELKASGSKFSSTQVLIDNLLTSTCSP